MVVGGSRQTSLITILSSDHGRLRREQRDIDKRDLQKAIKYGSVARCWGYRWKVEYDGIVFITDHFMRREVTCYPSPLSLAPTTCSDLSDHENAVLLHQKKQALARSHTVLVVDISGSMLTHDIHLHRDRQTAAYTMTALEFIAEQLFNGTANNKDLVSLVEFNKSARIVFEREPISWVLYNKLLKRRDSRDFRSREAAKAVEFYRADSNYLPALEKAAALLAKGDHEELALGMFFLSDGSPSDSLDLAISRSEVSSLICKKIGEISAAFKERLDAFFVGFACSSSEFAVLRSMKEAMNHVPNGAKGEFLFCEKIAQSIGDAVTSMVTSLTQTRLSLANGPHRNNTQRTLEGEDDVPIKFKYQYYPIFDHFLFDQGKRSFANYPGLPPGACNQDNIALQRARSSNPPRYLAINKFYIGKGAERVAFRTFLCDSPDDEASFLFSALVAKETKSVERIDEKIEFHRGFLETQSLSERLAQEFNKRVLAIPHDFNSNGAHPAIHFLPCSVLLVSDPSWPGRERGVLVEKMLEPSRWTKWNDNAGAVDGKIYYEPLDVEKELAKLDDLGMIAEIDEEESEEESVDDFDCEDSQNRGDEDTTEESPSDYLQAFSHFTYLFTNKKVLVCDLQGVYCSELSQPCFELTDPVIHYASKHRMNVFGRTDKGRAGHKLFFKTHKCNRVCKFLALSRKNDRWKKQWKDAGLFGL